MQFMNDEPMKIDLSYLTDPKWMAENYPKSGRKPTQYEFADMSAALQIERHYDTASRLIELAAWNAREAERLAKGSQQ